MPASRLPRARVIAVASAVVAVTCTAVAVAAPSWGAADVPSDVAVTAAPIGAIRFATTGPPTAGPTAVPTAGPTAPPSSTTPTPPSGTTTRPEDFGARGDGSTDDTAALQRAFDASPTGATVVLAAGRTYAHLGVLHLRTAGLHVTGPGTLLATAEATSSVWIEADDVLVDGGLVIRTATTTRRWEAWEQMGLRIVGRSGVVVRSVTVDGSAAAGIYIGNGATAFVLDHVTVQDTRADGIHVTGGANHGTLTSPVVRNSGDDGVAVVSYGRDGTPCHDITVVAPTVLGTTWGRGLSVVGGTRVTETDIDVRDTSAAAVYVASEGAPWFTTAAQQVVVTGGSISGANTDRDVDHGAVLVLSGRTGVVPADITVQGLRIVGTRSSASRNLGVITYGDAPARVLFAGIAISGGPRSAYQGNTPASAYRLVGVTHDGVPVPVGG